MKKILLFSIFFLLPSLLFSEPNLEPHEKSDFFETFANLDNWEELKFPKIKTYSLYSVTSFDQKQVLEIKGENSASALIMKESFNVYDFPVIAWKWKVMNIFENVNEKKKSGDDYPLRIYVAFDYESSELRFFERQKYKLAKRMYGEYPPIASVNYVWASTSSKGDCFKSPYSERSSIFVIQSGVSKLNQWREETRNILDDYRYSFKKDPPKYARVAIMGDGDNSKQAFQSYLEFLKLSSGN